MIVYQIINEVTMDRYVGASIHKNHTTRFNQHKWHIKNEKHGNSRIKALADKYGADSFSYEILESFDATDKEFLVSREQFYIDTLKPTLNIAPLSDSNFGIKKSKQLKDYMSDLITGMIQDGKIKRKSTKGLKQSEQARINMSKAHQRNKICLYDRYTLQLLKIYNTRREMMGELGVTDEIISTAITNSLGTYKNYIIRYGHIEPLTCFKEYSKCGDTTNKPVGVYSESGELLRIYRSKIELCKVEKISRSRKIKVMTDEGVRYGDNIIKYVK